MKMAITNYRTCRAFGLIILVVLFCGCATQTLPGKVVVVESVADGRRPSAGAAGTGVNAGTAAAQGAVSGGATSPLALGVGLAVGGIAAVVDAITNNEKTVTVYVTRDGSQAYFNQKPTPEVFRFRPGDKAVYSLDKDGDLVLIPYNP